MSDYFKRQDEFLKTMVEMWRKDRRLKPFDLYFRWKTGDISTADWRTRKDEIRRMRTDAAQLLESLWDERGPGGEPLEKVVEAIDDELINVSQILGI